MRDYGKVSPKFWTGKTGKAIRGDAEAQIVALYLMTSPHSTMIGVYHQPVSYMAIDTGLPLEGAWKGLQRCIEAGFCTYDEESETVFVVEMAVEQVGEELKPGDNRLKGIRKQYEEIGSEPARAAFHRRYAAEYGLPPMTESGSPNARAYQAPSKPLASQEQEQEQEQREKPPIPPAKAVGTPGRKRAQREKGEGITYPQFVQACREAGERPLPPEHSVFAFAQDSGTPREYLELAWREFARQYRDTQKTQAGVKGWRQKFENCVRRNWFKLWWFNADGDCELTTAGQQLKRERDADQKRKEARQAEEQGDREQVA